MESRKASVVVDYKITLKGSNDVVDEGYIFYVLDKEQYERLKSSYATGKYKNMHEDSDIADICKLFCAEVEIADNKSITFDYPEDVIDNWTFEDLADAYENPMPLEEMQAIADDSLKDFEDEINAIADEVYRELLDEEARNNPDKSDDE